MLDTGKLSPQLRSSFLTPGFVERLQTQARRYAVIEKIKSRREWLFGEMINQEWCRLSDEIKQEVTKDGYYVECSFWINEAVGFPVVSASGETLRRWCEIAASFENMPGLEIIREELSFDHFRRARSLARKGKVSVPAFALATAAAERLTAEEMTQRFDPPQAPDDYNRIMGSLDFLETTEYLKKFPIDKREQAYSLIRQLRQLLS